MIGIATYGHRWNFSSTCSDQQLLTDEAEAMMYGCPLRRLLDGLSIRCCERDDPKAFLTKRLGEPQGLAWRIPVPTLNDPNTLFCGG